MHEMLLSEMQVPKVVHILVTKISKMKIKIRLLIYLIDANTKLFLKGYQQMEVIFFHGIHRVHILFEA